jgi:acyl-CoA synthetase (NDP forming)
MALLEALGFQVPLHVVTTGEEGVPDLDVFPGDRVVVKILDPGVAHRTEVGGVQVVPREEAAVRAALAALAARSRGPGGRFLIQEWVPHETVPGGELLLGCRWTRAFGPVVTLGLGGVDAELLTRSARPGTLQWIGEAWDRDGGGGSSAEAGGRDGLEELVAELDTLPLVRLATGRTRGRAGRVAVTEVARAVARFRELARVAPRFGITEVEVNPLVFSAGRAVALDVLVRRGPPPPAPRTVEPEAARTEGIAALLRPRSMAVVGASGRSMNPGRVILRNLVGAGFPRERIQVVKPGKDSLDGCRCVADVAALDPVDVLVVGVAAAEVPGLLEEVTHRGTARSVLLVSAGLGEGRRRTVGRAGRGAPSPPAGDAVPETDDPARALRRVLALPGAPVVNGGNCLGIRSRPGGYDALFLPPHKLGPQPRESTRSPSSSTRAAPVAATAPHPVALLAQSGAFAVARANGLPWLDPRYVITVGNQVDLTVGEYLEALRRDPEVRVVAAYVEGFAPGDGRRFLEAAATFREEGRTVILYRAGRTAHGEDAMASHTASVAGDYAVTRALAEAQGVLVAETVREFQGLLGLAVRLDGRELRGRNIGLLSNAGFECVAMADALERMEPARLSEATRGRLVSILRQAGLADLVEATNPFDVTPILGDGGFAEAVEALLTDAGVDVGVIGCVPMTPALETLPAGAGHPEDLDAPHALAARLGALWRRTRKAWVVVVDAGPLYDPLVRALEGYGIPVLRTADETVRLLGRYVAARLD